MRPQVLEGSKEDIERKPAKLKISTAVDVIVQLISFKLVNYNLTVTQEIYHKWVCCATAG